MIIGIAALAFASSLAFGEIRVQLVCLFLSHSSFIPVIRQMLVHENRRLDEDELGGVKGANRKRIEEFARLEGISIEEAIEKKRGFRYLY